ncbi:hypothetical protein BFJ72_g9605 [Fusarium proliferatum]|uniref:Uncharacterized protein n=1 Tax=Gibberella intermedia TaxID=948311 RepID=A0A420SY24_GIBIN|nr:hypothetical protein BFJ72_g9605 [Fusarium proliferatum]
MLTGFEALGAASAVLQVISFATDVVVACKDAYDGATTSHHDLQRYAGQMSEAVGRVHTRCEQMNNANSKFASPKLQNIAKECKDAADKLEAEVQYLTSMSAQGDIWKSIHKSFRAWKHRKKLQGLEESLSKYQRVMRIELTSHLCSQGDAIYFQQDASFGKLDTDIQFLVNQLAQGMTDVKDLVKREHAATRCTITQEGARVEAAINWHTDSQVLELRTTADAERKCEAFLRSLKATRMKQRYNEILDSTDASFSQVFATYKEIEDLYYGVSREYYHSEYDGNTDDSDTSEDHDQSEDDSYSEHEDDPDDANGPEDHEDTSDDSEDADSEGYGSSEAARDLYMGDTKYIHHSWHSFNSWLISDDKLFYILGKPGSGKSTLVKFILNKEQTRDLIQEWSPDAILLSHFFWKIGSEEQNSIKGLWCSLLYKRLEDQHHLILSTLQHFRHLSLHSEYYDWSLNDLQDVWNYVANLDPRHMCVFIDGLDEIRNEDGFPQLAQTIQSISRIPNTKLCVSARPEPQIVRWLKMTEAHGILLEELTKFDMHVYVRERFDQLIPSSPLSPELFNDLRRELVNKAEGVFLWLYLAIKSIIVGVENEDSEVLLSKRLQDLPGDLEKLYEDMWQRANAGSKVYREKARRYFCYLLSAEYAEIAVSQYGMLSCHPLPLIFQIACAEEPEIQKRILMGTDMIGASEIVRICNETLASINTRCAGLVEVYPQEPCPPDEEEHVGDMIAYSKAVQRVVFIHRTAHDFLIDTEAGEAVLGCESLERFPWQTRLLKGMVCMVKVLVIKWDMPCRLGNAVQQITEFANRWRSKGLQVATEMLDIVKPLFDKHFTRSDLDFWVPQPHFLSWLIVEEILADYVLSCLTNECPPHLATTIMRDGWRPGSDVRLPKRTFDALTALGADPHEYGVLSHTHNSFLQLVPFVEKPTAFTNFLMSSLILLRNDLEYQETESLVSSEEYSSPRSTFEILKIALDMAKTCPNLNAVVALFACFLDTGGMIIMPLKSWTGALDDSPSQNIFAIFEVNIQLLLLYLLSEVGTNLGQSVLANSQAEDILSRIGNPSAKLRYFKRPKATNDKIEQRSNSPLTLQRTEPQVPSMSRSEIEHLFEVDLDLHTKVLFDDGQTGLSVTTQYVEKLEVEEVNIEDAMISLAAENLGFASCEELGIAPSLEHMKWSQQFDSVSWNLFPLTMRRLKAAAPDIEESEGSMEVDD